jgi:hypothetical protein
MAKLILILATLLSTSAYADFLGFGTDDGYASRLPPLIEKLKSLKLSNDPGFEDTFNLTVKNIENGVEEEKLFCAGESTDPKGRTLPKEQKQLCFRELKSQYMDAVSVIFDMKKKYLDLIHKRQMDRLSEIQSKMKADIEKNF